MRELLSDFGRQLGQDPWRVLLTIAGIVIGSASVVFLASTLQAAKWALERANQEASGADISRVTERRAGPMLDSRTVLGMTDRDVRAMTHHEKLGPRDISPSISSLSRQATVRGQSMAVGVQGGDSRFLEIGRFELEHGRLPTEAERDKRLCVIGQEIHHKLFGGVWPLEHDELVLDGATSLTVVGVLAPRPPIDGGDGDGSWKFDRRIWVSNMVYGRSIAPFVEYDEIALRHPAPPDRPVDLRAAALRLTTVLENLHLGVRNFEFDALSKGNQIDLLISLALGAILIGCGIVATTVGSVNVMNAELVLLHERTREYGIRRALGLSASGLAARVLLESCAYTTLGSAMGVALGLLGAKLLSLGLTKMLLAWPFEVVGWSIVACSGAAIVSGCLAGWLPARRASELAIAECLRTSG